MIRRLAGEFRGRDKKKRKYLDRRIHLSGNLYAEIYLPRVLEYERLEKDTSLGRSPDAAAEGYPARKGPAKETGRDGVSRPLTEWKKERARDWSRFFRTKSEIQQAEDCEGEDNAASSSGK